MIGTRRKGFFSLFDCENCDNIHRKTEDARGQQICGLAYLNLVLSRGYSSAGDAQPAIRSTDMESVSSMITLGLMLLINGISI